MRRYIHIIQRLYIRVYNFISQYRVRTKFRSNKKALTRIFFILYIWHGIFHFHRSASLIRTGVISSRATSSIIRPLRNLARREVKGTVLESKNAGFHERCDPPRERGRRRGRSKTRATPAHDTKLVSFVKFLERKVPCSHPYPSPSSFSRALV